MTTEEKRVDQLFWEFAKANDALLVKSFDRTFAESVDDYRRLEAEFVARMSDSAFGVLEIKRRIAEDMLMLTHDKHPPFEVCREAWNDLVRLGFSSIETECWKTRAYADCCGYDERPDEGLAVLEPLIAKLERLFEETKGSGEEYPARFYENELEGLRNLRDALDAQKRGEVIPWLETRREDETPP